MAETRIDAATVERLQQIHLLSRRGINSSHRTSPTSVDAGDADDALFKILAGLTRTAADLCYVHLGTATMVLDAGTDLGLSDEAVSDILVKGARLIDD